MKKEPSYLEAERDLGIVEEKQRRLIGMLTEKVNAIEQAAINEDFSLADKRLAEYKALETEMIFSNPGWPGSEEDKKLADKAENLTYKLNAKNITSEPVSLSELQSEMQKDIDIEAEEENRRLNTKKLDS